MVVTKVCLVVTRSSRNQGCGAGQFFVAPTPAPSKMVWLRVAPAPAPDTQRRAVGSGTPLVAKFDPYTLPFSFSIDLTWEFHVILPQLL